MHEEVGPLKGRSRASRSKILVGWLNVDQSEISLGMICIKLKLLRSEDLVGWKEINKECA